MFASHKKLILAASIAAILSGCSSSSDDKDSSPKAVNTAGAVSSASADAGTSSTGASSSAAPVITKSAVTAVGEIDGFGSVIVNGVHYETDIANIIIDGEVSTEEALDVGMLVKVNAKEVIDEADDEGPEAIDIHFYSKAAGTIAYLDAQAKTLTVMDQRILIDDETHLDSSINEITLAPLAEGVFVRVSGRTNADGDIVASRIDIREGETSQRLSGTVEAYDDTEKTAIVSGRMVDLTNADIEGIIKKGADVFVRGVLESDALNAEQVIVMSRSLKVDDAQTQSVMSIKGTVAMRDGVYTLNGYTLMNRGEANIIEARLANVTDELVTVIGTLNEKDQIVVASIAIEQPTSMVVQGVVTGLYSSNSNTRSRRSKNGVVLEETVVSSQSTRIKINGHFYYVQANTDFIDSDQQERFFNYKDINVDDRLIIDAYRNADNMRMAKSIERIASEQDTEKRYAKLLTSIKGISDDGLILTSDNIRVRITTQTVIDKRFNISDIEQGLNGVSIVIQGTMSQGELQADFIGKDYTRTKDVANLSIEEQVASHNKEIADIENVMAQIQEHQGFSQAMKNNTLRILKHVIRYHSKALDKLLTNTEIEEPKEDNSNDTPKALTIDEQIAVLLNSIKVNQELLEIAEKNQTLSPTEKAAAIKTLEEQIGRDQAILLELQQGNTGGQGEGDASNQPGNNSPIEMPSPELTKEERIEVLKNRIADYEQRIVTLDENTRLSDAVKASALARINKVIAESKAELATLTTQS